MPIPSRNAVTAALVIALFCAAEGSGRISGPTKPGPEIRPDRIAADTARELSDLVARQGVSGFEGDVRDALRAMLPDGLETSTDEAGNLTVTVGRGAPHLLVAAHVDEDGYIVSGITDEGYLRLHRVSTGAGHALYDQFLYGQPVMVRRTDGRLVAGVSVTVSAHLQRGRAATAATKGLDDIFVDVGAETRSDVEALGIKLLDTVALRERVQPLAGGRVAGVAAHARAQALALVHLARALAAPGARPNGTVTVAWTAQGLFGDRGLARLGRRLDPDRVVVLTRAQAGKETDRRGTFGTPGAGPVAFEAPAATAVPGQAGRPAPGSPRVQGLPSAWAPKTRLFSLPAVFVQTPVETIAVDDVAALARVLCHEAGVEPVTSVPARSPAVASADAVPSGHRAFEHLAALIDTYGVSGHEAEVRQAVAARLPKWARLETDERGNLWTTFGQGPVEMLFVAHTDELGNAIVNMNDDGTATIRRGGVYASAMESHPVLVHTAGGRVPAIVAPRNGYLGASEWQPRPEEIYLYFGTASREETERLGVRAGDTVTLRKQLAMLGGNRATARAIDDRAGCAALLAALEQIDPSRVRSRITFAWDVAEETGLVGAAALAERMHPAYVFPVDTFVSSDSPVDPQRIARIELGSGAVLRAVDNSSITPPEVVARVRGLAEGRRIPVSVGVTSGGNDGSQFSKVGSIVVPLSWPGRYSHSAVEVIDGRDLEALVDLILTLVESFPGEVR